MKNHGLFLAGGLLASVAIAILAASVARANGYTEDVPWQFQTTADQANLAIVDDLMEKKKGGYYDSFGPATITNNTTNTIGKQINCSIASTAAGNSAGNGQAATNSSPTVQNSATANATTTGNSANNGIGNDPNYPFLALNNLGSPLGTIDNTQGNTGSTMTSGISGGTTSTTGAVAGSGGQNSQVLNNDQNNSGAQTASVSNSTACSLAVSGP